MKHLKSSLRDLRQVFDRSVSVRYIAEPFVSFDAQRHAPDIWAFMEGKDFDVVGVRQMGLRWDTSSELTSKKVRLNSI